MALSDVAGAWTFGLSLGMAPGARDDEVSDHDRECLSPRQHDPVVFETVAVRAAAGRVDAVAHFRSVLLRRGGIHGYHEEPSAAAGTLRELRVVAPVVGILSIDG